MRQVAEAFPELRKVFFGCHQTPLGSLSVIKEHYYHPAFQGPIDQVGVAGHGARTELPRSADSGRRTGG
jgi:hypothetical protein